MTISWYFLTVALTCIAVNHVDTQDTETKQGLSVSGDRDLNVLVNHNIAFEVLRRSQLEQEITVNLIPQHADLVKISPTEFTFSDLLLSRTINVFGLKPGHLEVTSNSSSDQPWITSDLYVRITVANSGAIEYISVVFGWVYFIAWSISFYPQIYINFKRKSVVGLNFDFLALNVIGFTMYSIFNCGLYWIPEIQQEYAHRYPRGLNPVLLNDVIFSLHAIFATILTILQCLLYERSDQRVSKLAQAILAIFAVIIIVSAALVFGNVIIWLDFLYICSYIKLTISIIKYVPQALMNYQRKSTVGWSIGNILLDFTGGILSMLQMILNAYNYDDWVSIFGDPTKFGMGLFSVLFDIFFMLQHYVFYSTKPHRYFFKNVILAKIFERATGIKRQNKIVRYHKLHA